MERAKRISLGEPGAPERVEPRAHTCQVSLDEVDGPRSRYRCAEVVVGKYHVKGAAHMKISTIGLDLAKISFRSTHRQ